MPFTNLSPEFSTTAAVALTLIAAFMWGTWFISIKHLKDYPLDGFYVTLFFSSVIIVWVIGLLLDGPALVENIGDVYRQSPMKILVTIGSGILYILGMRMTLHVFNTIGLSLSQPILSSVNTLVGTLISAVLGGTPEGFSPLLMSIACMILVGAVVLSMIAGNLKSKSDAKSEKTEQNNYSRRDLWRSLGLLTLASALMPAYTLGLSYGLKTITQPVGLAVLPFMGVLSIGAFLGSMISSGTILTKNKQWNRVFKAPWSIHKFGILSGLFHFGGNIIHTFATASLSSVISWPLGLTYGLWTQFWGLIYGEFKSAPRKAYVALISAVCLYLIGAVLVAIQA